MAASHPILLAGGVTLPHIMTIFSGKRYAQVLDYLVN